jgi:hypothetical protein
MRIPKTERERLQMLANVHEWERRAQNADQAIAANIIAHVKNEYGVELQLSDLTVQNEGSLYLLRPVSDAGREWIGEYIPDGAQRWRDAVAVEHRYIEAIVCGAAADGMVVR